MANIDKIIYAFLHSGFCNCTSVADIRKVFFSAPSNGMTSFMVILTAIKVLSSLQNFRWLVTVPIQIKSSVWWPKTTLFGLSPSTTRTTNDSSYSIPSVVQADLKIAENKVLYDDDFLIWIMNNSMTLYIWIILWLYLYNSPF